jgi:type IV pilus assembly protein PilZ
MEQRRFVRAPLGIALFFTRQDDPDAEFIEAVGRDISLAGMFIETATPATFGSEVVVHITLPGGKEESRIPAHVRWTNAEGMGLQLGSLSVRDTRLITELVREHEEVASRARGACTD